MHKILIASDHAGLALKGVLIEYVHGLGYEVEDLGATAFNADDDYPDFVTPLAERVVLDSHALGIAIGGSGQGEAMCANRVVGVRSAVFYGPMAANGAVDIDGASAEDGYDIVRLPRRHNDANVLSIGARFVSDEVAREAVRIFLETSFSEAPRHLRRIAKF